VVPVWPSDIASTAARRLSPAGGPCSCGTTTQDRPASCSREHCLALPDLP
jgi:hypothetical protein